MDSLFRTDELHVDDQTEEEVEEVEGNKVSLCQAKEAAVQQLEFALQNEALEPEWEVTITKLHVRLQQLGLEHRQSQV